MKLRRSIFAVAMALALLAAMVPAFGGAVTPTTGTITIHKFDMTGADMGGPVNDGTEIDLSTKNLGNALEGVSFQVTQVLDRIGNSPNVTPSTMTVAQAKDIIAANATEYTAGNPTNLYKATLTTNSSGTVSTPALEQGVYLVEELGGGGVTSVVAPFLVYLPLTVTATGDPNGTPLYDVHVYPKNETMYINKVADTDLLNIDDPGTLNNGERISWTITASIPADIATMDLSGGGFFYIEDVLDERLSLAAVTVFYDDGATPTPNRVAVGAGDYTVTPASFPAKGGTIKIDFDTATSVASLTAAQAAGQHVEVKLTTYVNIGSAYELDQTIANTAKLYYKNDGGDTGITIEPPIPPTTNVHGLSVVKVDADAPTTYLEGAVFDLYWCATQNGTYVKVATGTTDTNGLIYWQYDSVGGNFNSGSQTNTYVGAGYYYVRETKAPAGYHLMTEISDVAELAALGPGHTWKLENTDLSGDFNLPTTGGSGTMWFTIGGGLLVLVGIGVFAAWRRKTRG